MVLRLVVLLLLMLPAQLVAQGYPLPVSEGAPPALCTGCPGPSAGLPTAQVPPALRFSLRLVDSQLTKDYQAGFGMRTLRAILVRSDETKVYAIIGSTFAAYNKARLFTREGEALVPLSAQRYTDAERYLLWDEIQYAEGASGWQTYVTDGQDRLFDFSLDDRGYIYLGYSIFGWGICTTTPLRLVKQVKAQSEPRVTATKILAARNGSATVVFVAGNSASWQAWNVQAPAAPAYLGTISGGPFGWSTTEDRQTVAIITTVRGLRIARTTSLLMQGAGAGQLFPGQYYAVSGYGSEFWAASVADGVFTLSRFREADGQWFETRFPQQQAANWSPGSLHVDGDLMALVGFNAMNAGDAKVYRISESGPAEIDLGGFFSRYYTAPPPGYAKPDNYTAQPHDAAIIRHGGRAYVAYSGHGLGDIYEIVGSVPPRPPIDPPPPPPPPPVDPPAGRSFGDANGDGTVSVLDVFYLINFLFGGGPPPW